MYCDRSGGHFFPFAARLRRLLSAYQPSGEISTGFSDQVELGRIGEIQQSGAVVMHIQIDGDESGGSNVKWRGVTLNNFNGRTWTNNRCPRVLSAQPDGRFIFPQKPGQVGEAPARPIDYRVLMEPVGMNIFFLAGTPLSLKGNYRNVAVDDGGAAFDLDPQHPVNRYQATSDVAKAEAADLRKAGGIYPSYVDRSYLGLPSRLDRRIAQLAQQVSASADNEYDKVAAIETYLRTHFQYTLQLPGSVASDPLANFLFQRKRGHCEYFASSMAVMVRSLRIPARLVNGFQSGEFNDLTSQYVVRASDAHSWVEIFFPGYGWIAFDPTPGGVVATRRGWNRVGLYFDAISSFWRDWVVNYDAGHQQALAITAKNGSRQFFASGRLWWRRQYKILLAMASKGEHTVTGAPLRWGIAGVLVSLLLWVAINARTLWQKIARLRLAARPQRSPRRAATIWYERMTGGRWRSGAGGNRPPRHLQNS